jgi:hypothetical protein
MKIPVRVSRIQIEVRVPHIRPVTGYNTRNIPFPVSFLSDPALAYSSHSKCRSYTSSQIASCKTHISLKSLPSPIPILCRREATRSAHRPVRMKSVSVRINEEHIDSRIFSPKMRTKSLGPFTAQSLLPCRRQTLLVSLIIL